MTENSLECVEDTLSRRLIAGIEKLHIALRSQAWQEGEEQGLTPTQGRILALLRAHSEQGMRLSEVADALAAKASTVSVAVNTLVQKGLVAKARRPEDGRMLALTLTDMGRKSSEQVVTWPDFLLEAIQELSSIERAIFLRSLMKMIRTLQMQGKVSASPMCGTCRFFRPHVYKHPDQPHYCMALHVPFGDLQLRLECVEHESASSEQAQKVWKRFIHFTRTKC